MKKYFTVLVWIGITAVSLSSCKVAFTPKLRKQIEDNNLDLKKIQYYNSQKIVLKRNLTDKEAKVAKGEVTLNNGVYIEEIEIKKHTLGVCDKFTKDQLFIRFEEGKDEKHLIFEEKSWNEAYQLRASKWDEKNVQLEGTALDLLSSYTGKVQYDGKTYYTTAYVTKPKLLIKKNETRKYSRTKRTAKGVQVQ